MTAASEVFQFATEGRRIAYRDTGGGPPLVLLHGGFLDHRMWDDQIPALAAEYRVIAPDARGHGESSNANGPFRPTDDVADLLRGLDTGPAILVGLSMGAATAVDTALEHPDLVRAVVASGAGTSEPEFTSPWTVGVNTAWTKALAAGDIDGWLDAFTLFAPGPHRPLDAVDPGVVRRLRAMCDHTVRKHTTGEPPLITPVADTWARASRIRVPVLALNGSLDADDHLAMSARLIAAVPHGRTALIDAAAHYPNMERPAEFTAALTDFLRTL
ncbi:alpha/beta fold hydrolase [Streptomyces sp. NPDC014894]|uniref:alpha/beta fold hydrolase n=1 Tax=Streptomyces sp. NPDC014894 TaxID=3364931 RepID=UPI0037010E0D